MLSPKAKTVTGNPVLIPGADVPKKILSISVRTDGKEELVRHSILGVTLLSLAASTTLLAQEAAKPRVSLETLLPGGGHVMTPQSSIQRPIDIGRRAHTHFKILVPAGRPEGSMGFAEEYGSPEGTPVTGYYAETPASLACLYKLVTVTTGCNPYTLPNSKVATGGSKAIAIVDAYDYPTALADLKKYSTQFGLPAPTANTFTVTWPSSQPAADPNCANYGGWNCWAAESALDIEMAHTAAPSAHIYLVEAASNSFSDLFAAVYKAITLVQAAGGGEVSMSWGGGEFSSETTYDTALGSVNTNKVVFFASTGDSEGTEFPSVSPNVVAVGGTTISRSPATLAFEGENAWEDSGGGFSLYELRPAYQNAISSRIGTHRGVPDVSAIANPRTGVWVYMSFDNTYYVNGVPTLEPWNIFGGTSVASPLFAAIVNHAGGFSASSMAELTKIYANASVAADFRDVAYGTCGYYQGWSAVTGWDPCTGNGSPLGNAGK